MKICLSFIVIFHTVLLGFNPEDIIHTDISVPDANDLISSNNDLIIIDVREPSEYCGATGHVPGAYNYPWTSGVLEISYIDLSPTDEILVICRSGGRSNAAANFLDSKGYLKVYDMLDGTNAWKSTGYTTADCVDSDQDGFNDDLDNCPNVYNPRQTDSDKDKIGNPCDNDCPCLDDLNLVNFADFKIIAASWLQAGPNLPGDLNSDQLVNIEDIIVFANYWLTDCCEPVLPAK